MTPVRVQLLIGASLSPLKRSTTISAISSACSSLDARIEI
nr:MAG TPA: hypothetical protein [Caudoviricetes sp.]DAR87461.1 MAG TPA: hypothetical protein [Caudoviricetes sp.]DAU58354.1 MAG TPA: hypothetical protein [Caudoviricetes sp.]